MCAVRIWVFVPHSDNDVRPWVSSEKKNRQKTMTTTRLLRWRYSLVVESLRKEMHDGGTEEKDEMCAEERSSAVV